MNGYNGWANYPTWNIKLWIDNDQGSQEYWNEQAIYAYKETKVPEYLTKSQSARYDLTEQIKNEFEDMSLDNNGTTGPLTDILSWALSQVNWDEIAEALLEDNIDEYIPK